MGIALVTEAGGYRGHAIARELGLQGFKVAIHETTAGDGAKKTVGRIVASGGVAAAFQADLVQEAQVKNLFMQVQDWFGGSVTCLINTIDQIESDASQVVDSLAPNEQEGNSLRASALLTRAMATQGLQALPDESGDLCSQGVILYVMDQYARKRIPDYVTATLARDELYVLTRTAAQALAPAIRVNAIACGPVSASTHDFRTTVKKRRSAQLSDRLTGQRDLVAAANFFLKIPSVTGQLLAVDG